MAITDPYAELSSYLKKQQQKLVREEKELGIYKEQEAQFGEENKARAAAAAQAIVEDLEERRKRREKPEDHEMIVEREWRAQRQQKIEVKRQAQKQRKNDVIANIYATNAVASVEAVSKELRFRALEQEQQAQKEAAIQAQAAAAQEAAIVRTLTTKQARERKLEQEKAMGILSWRQSYERRPKEQEILPVIKSEVPFRLDVGLYVHYPFCVHKCPYCDFFSLPIGANASRDHVYVDLLIKDFKLRAPLLQGRKISTIYIGGGTPSLCPASEWARLLDAIQPYLTADAEISFEANPGTVSSESLKAYKNAGFNRISIGVQSFNDEALKRLGRIHNGDDAVYAIKSAQRAGFENINIDIMHGLMRQDALDSLDDLKTAVSLNPTHLSWYELTLEEGTHFGKKPPKGIPDEDVLYRIEQTGFEYLDRNNFEHYEVSGYAKRDPINSDCNAPSPWRCRHNQNYWVFGDYLGLGCGGSQKLTYLNPSITPELLGAWLQEQQKQQAQLEQQPALSTDPCGLWATLTSKGEMLLDLKRYLQSHGQPQLAAELLRVERRDNPENMKVYQEQIERAQVLLEQGVGYAAQRASEDEDTTLNGHWVFSDELPFEFMLNRMRLWRDYIESREFEMHTGLNREVLREKLELLQERELIKLDKDLSFSITEHGKLMLNDAIYEFL